MPSDLCLGFSDLFNDRFIWPAERIKTFDLLQAVTSFLQSFSVQLLKSLSAKRKAFVRKRISPLTFSLSRSRRPNVWTEKEKVILKLTVAFKLCLFTAMLFVPCMRRETSEKWISIFNVRRNDLTDLIGTEIWCNLKLNLGFGFSANCSLLPLLGLKLR